MSIQRNIEHLPWDEFFTCIFLNYDTDFIYDPNNTIWILNI